MSGDTDGLEVIEEKILACLLDHNGFLTDKVMTRKLEGEVSVESRSAAINALLRKKKIELMKTQSGSQTAPGGIGYRMIDEERAAILRKLDDDSMAVYELVKKKGNQGTWSADLRKDLNYIQQPTITRILNALTTEHKLLKVVHSVNNRTRKVYMEINTQPSKDITGGPWYTGTPHQVFDHEFVVELRAFIKQKVQQKTVMTLEELHMEVGRVVAGPEKLDIVEVGYLVDSLVQQNELQPLPPAIIQLRAEDDVRYRNLEPETKMFEVGSRMDMKKAVQSTSVPCIHCTLREECQVGGVISPQTCQYMADWTASMF
jgi:DNA-directed RNA polymerase III subunit RPC6